MKFWRAEPLKGQGISKHFHLPVANFLSLAWNNLMPTCMVPWNGNRKTIAIGRGGSKELVAISPLVFGREWIFFSCYRTNKQVLELEGKCWWLFTSSKCIRVEIFIENLKQDINELNDSMVFSLMISSVSFDRDML